MPTKLSVFNAALTHLGEPAINSVDVAKEVGRVLRSNWEDAVFYCLEEGPWTFGKVRQQLARLAATPDFGYTYYYQKPTDWAKTVHLSSVDDSPHSPWPDFEDEGTRIATDETELYMLYISTDAINAPGNWSQRFADYVAARLAFASCERITGSRSHAEQITKVLSGFEAKATNHNASQQPAKQMPQGSWVRAAMYGARSTRQRENGR